MAQVVNLNLGWTFFSSPVLCSGAKEFVLDTATSSSVVLCGATMLHCVQDISLHVVVVCSTFCTLNNFKTIRGKCFFRCDEQLYSSLCGVVGQMVGSTKISPFFGGHFFCPRRLKFGTEVAAIVNSRHICVQSDLKHKIAGFIFLLNHGSQHFSLRTFLMQDEAVTQKVKAL